MNAEADKMIYMKEDVLRCVRQSLREGIDVFNPIKVECIFNLGKMLITKLTCKVKTDST